MIHEDLKWFVDDGPEKLRERDHGDSDQEDGHFRIYEVENLATTDLFEIISPEVTVRDQDDWKVGAEGGDKYIVEGSELTVCVSNIGQKIRDILKNYF